MTISMGIIYMDNPLISMLKGILYGWCLVLVITFLIRSLGISRWWVILVNSITLCRTTLSNSISSNLIRSKWDFRINSGSKIRMHSRIRWTTVPDKDHSITSLNRDSSDGRMSKWGRLNLKGRKEEKEGSMDQTSRSSSSSYHGISENKSIT